MQVSVRPSSASTPAVIHAVRLASKRPLSPAAPALDRAAHSQRSKRPRVSRSATPSSAISLVSQPSSRFTAGSPSYSPPPSSRIYAPHAPMRTHALPVAACDSPHFSPQPCKPYFDHAIVDDAPLAPDSPYYSPPAFSPTPQPSEQLCDSQPPPQQSLSSSPYYSPERLEHSAAAGRARARHFAHQSPEQHFSHEWNEADLVSAVCAHLQALCDRHNRNGITSSSNKFHAFFSQYRQPFALSFYITRLVQFCNCSFSAFIIALIFLQRVQLKCAQLAVNDMNVHRLFCTALVLAIKNVDDEVFSNGYYARVGGITLHELNELEALMLNLLDWNVCCAVERFEQLEKCLLHRLALLVVHSDDDDEQSDEHSAALTCAA